MEENEKNLQEPESSDKISKQFDAKLRKVVALFQGDAPLKKSKLPKNAMGEIVAELLTEKKKERAEQFKTKASELIEKYVQFTKDTAEAKKQMENIVTNKKKEFIKAMDEVLNLVEGIDQLEKEYSDALKTNDVVAEPKE